MNKAAFSKSGSKTAGADKLATSTRTTKGITKAAGPAKTAAGGEPLKFKDGGAVEGFKRGTKMSSTMC